MVKDSVLLKMVVLTPIRVRAKPFIVKMLTDSCFVLRVIRVLGSQFILTMRKAAFKAKLTFLVQLVELANFCFKLF